MYQKPTGSPAAKRNQQPSNDPAERASERREKGLWTFLTWSFFLSQAIGAEQALAGAARLGQVGEDGPSADNSVAQAGRTAPLPIDPVTFSEIENAAPQVAQQIASLPLQMAPIGVAPVGEAASADVASAPQLNGGPLGSGSGGAVADARTSAPTPGPVVDPFEPEAGGNPPWVGPVSPPEGGGGGPIAEILDPIVDVVEGVVDPIVGIVEDVVTPVLDIVEDVVTPVLGIVEDVVTPIVGIVEDVVTPVLGIVEDVVTPVLGIVEDVVTPIVGVVEGVVEPIVGVVDGAVDTVVQPVLETVGDVLAPVTGILEAVVTPVVGIAGHVVDDVAGPLLNFAGDITSPVTGVVGDVVGALAPVAGGAAAPVAGVGGDIAGVAGDILEPVADVVAPVVSTIGGLAGELTDGVVEPVAETLAGLTDAATLAAGSLLGELTSGPTGTLADVLGMTTPLDAVLDGLAAPVAETLSELLEGAGAIVQSTTDENLWPIVDNVTELFGDLTEDAGSGLAGIFDPVVDATGDATDTLGALADGAAAGGTGLLGGLVGLVSQTAATAADDVAPALEAAGDALQTPDMPLAEPEPAAPCDAPTPIDLGQATDSSILVSVGLSVGASLGFGSETTQIDQPLNELFSNGIYTDYGLTMQSGVSSDAARTEGAPLQGVTDLADDLIGAVTGDDISDATSLLQPAVLTGAVEDIGLRGLFDGLGL